MTGSSQESFLSSTSIATAAAVKALVFDPRGKSVSVSTFCGRPTCRTPNAFRYTMRSSFTTATARPGISHSRMALSMDASRCSRGSWLAAVAAVMKRRTAPMAMIRMAVCSSVGTFDNKGLVLTVGRLSS